MENGAYYALDFDAQYARYGAYATTPDRNRIIITFDQGYENGYTGKILDTLKEKQVSALMEKIFSLLVPASQFQKQIRMILNMVEKSRSI